MNTKLEDLLNASKLNELLHKKELEEEKKSTLVWVLAIIGAVATVAAIAFAVYKYFTPDYLADLDDDFDDDFYDDLDDDSDDDAEESKEKETEEEKEEK
jgi:hypothetical protein